VEILRFPVYMLNLLRTGAVPYKFLKAASNYLQLLLYSSRGNDINLILKNGDISDFTRIKKKFGKNTCIKNQNVAEIKLKSRISRKR
jgi:hypothetical protein